MHNNYAAPQRSLCGNHGKVKNNNNYYKPPATISTVIKIVVAFHLLQSFSLAALIIIIIITQNGSATVGVMMTNVGSDHYEKVLPPLQ